MATHQQKMIKARANLIMGQPFFGTLALRLKIQEDASIKTANCDGATLKYNPAYVDKLSVQQTMGMIAHEVLHVGFLHHTRRGARNAKQWNEACDYSINPILKASNFELPENTYCNPAYEGMTAEHIYTLIPAPPPQDKNGKGKGKGGGSNEDEGDGQGESQNNDPGGNGGVEDSENSQNKGASQSQQNGEEAEWKVAMAQAAHVAKQAGNLPAAIERMMQELFEPILPWRNILRRFMTEKAADDFSWARGNRRFIAQGLYLPSRTSEGTGEIVVVIDTSGSIGPKELNEFGSEIKAIVDEVKPSKTYVVYCDAAIAHIDTFGPNDELNFAAHGGGGTDFRPPFKWIEEMQLAPKCLVYLTDGYGPFPDHDIPYPTLWCINNHQVTPPFGEHLILET